MPQIAAPSVFFAGLILGLVGCSPAAPTARQRVLVLPDGRFQVGGQTTDLDGALRRLGPPERTRIEISICADLPFARLREAQEAVKHAGYRHLAFSHLEGTEQSLCRTRRRAPVRAVPAHGDEDAHALGSNAR
jgi:hypothetical protein